MNLLIADDENLELKVLEKTFKKHFLNEFNIYLASNGKKAMEYLKDTGIDIAVLDIEMPGMNGIELAKHIRNKNPKSVIIFITAYDKFDYAIEAMYVKAFDYLLKPWKEDRLIDLIERAIANIGKNDLGKSKNENPQKEIIIKYINTNYKKDISAGDVAGVLGYTDVYFSRLFKQLFNDNFINYLTGIRIENAKILLRDRSFTIKEVGESVGYNDSNYFAKVFRRSEGISPTEYRSKYYS